MRVRYEMVGNTTLLYGVPWYKCECDLSEKNARRMYKELFENGRCKWAELVNEDMEVIDQFDHTVLANTFYELFG